MAIPAALFTDQEKEKQRLNWINKKDNVKV